MNVRRKIIMYVSTEIPDGLDEDEQREFVNEFDESLDNEMKHMERVIEAYEEMDISYEWKKTMEAES